MKLKIKNKKKPFIAEADKPEHGEVKKKKNKRKFTVTSTEENGVESRPAKRPKKQKPVQSVSEANNTNGNHDIEITTENKNKNHASSRANITKNKNDTNDSNIRKNLSLPHQIKNERESRTIFIGNLPVKFQEKSLKKLASQYGEIDTIRIRGAIPECEKIPKKVAVNKKMFNKDQNSLVAYVVYKKVEDAQNALALNGELFEEHHLRVTLLTEKVFDKHKGIFIGNLRYKITEEEMWDFFKDCGDISSVRIIRDSKTGLCKGFGYVNFKSEDSVEFALKLDGENVQGREIRIKRLLSEGKLEKLKKKKEFNIVKKNQPNDKFKSKKGKTVSNKEGFARRFKSKKEKNTSDKPDSKFKKKNMSKTDVKKKKLAEKLMAKPKKKVITS